MVNIRINGSKTEIRRFIKILRRVKQVNLHEDSISDFHKMRKLGFYNKYLNVSCLHDKDKNKLNDDFSLNNQDDVGDMEHRRRFESRAVKDAAILLMFAMTVRVYKSVKLYNQRNVESRQESVKGDSASPGAVSGSAVGRDSDGEKDDDDNYDDEDENQENQTFEDTLSKENDSDEVNIDTTNMDSFLAFMSDESYEKILDLVSGTCEEKSCTSAKRLDYQEINQDTFLVTSYILLSDGSVYKSDYNMKSGAVTFAATDYREADIIALRNKAEEAESLAIAKEQEAESKKLEDAKKDFGSDEAKASSESKKNSISINIKNKKTYKLTKKVRIKSSKRLKSIKLNGKKIRFKKNSKRKTFKLRSYKGKLKKSRWNKLIVKDVTGNKLTIKFKIKK